MKGVTQPVATAISCLEGPLRLGGLLITAEGTQTCG